MKRRLSILIACSLVGSLSILMSGCSKEPAQLVTSNGEKVLKTATQDGQAFVPNEMLVKFKSGISASARSAALSKVSGSVAEKILTKAMKRRGDNEGIALVKTPLAVEDAVGRIKGSPEIEFAEPNYIYTHDETSDDTYYMAGYLWGMYGDETTPANIYGSQAGEAWATGHVGSSEVYVGIIDEGYMYTHVDIAGNAGTNPGEIPGNGLDDDGNGYVDDVYGWDFTKNDNTIFDGINDAHGTHVAGTIGAVGGNGRGVAGVCWHVSILDAKFLGKQGGTTANAIKAVDYFTDLKTRGVNLVAINNSWGGGGFSQLLQDAIERANEEEILFIASAGNAGTDNDLVPHYPGSYPNENVIVVASITSTGDMSSFSNYGATSVDIGAPGSVILSCVPMAYKGDIVSAYAYYSGTSMATPHVTGAAALYAASHGGKAARIKAAILNSAIATPSLSGKCITGGRLNVSHF